MNPGVDVRDRHFEDYVAGTVEEFGDVEMTLAEILEFARRYDPQPIHIDAESAARGPFGGIIASGWHTAAVTMRLLVAHYLSSVASLASPGLEELRWLAPVRPGDRLRVRVTVLDTRRSRSKPDRGVVRSRTEVWTAEGVQVMSMISLNLLRCRNFG